MQSFVTAAICAVHMNVFTRTIVEVVVKNNLNLTSLELNVNRGDSEGRMYPRAMKVIRNDG